MPVAERAWLRQLRRRLQERAGATPYLRLGIGDDAAVLDLGGNHEAVITTDLFVEGVHFLRRRDAPQSCGYRLAARALSDLAAMGAEPVAVFLSCAWPADLATSWTRAFYRGLEIACGEAGAVIAGGDLAASSLGMVMDITGLGRIRRGQALRRGGAKPGDRIFVSGALGLGALGRALVHGGRRPQSAEERQAAARHRRPRARTALGRALVGIASAAIDISDGLATDLHHLCDESGSGCLLDADCIPRPSRADGLEMALGGGEDYELLFTVPPRRLPRLRRLRLAGESWTEIGLMTGAQAGRLLASGGKRRRLPRTGWQHWAAE